MSQHSRIKLFRTFKVVFYCCGLPLFFLCVLSMSNMFRGKYPFVGTADGLFNSLTVPLVSPWMYGVWVALGVWAVLAIIQLVLHFTVKNRKARMISMVAAILVIMLVPVFVMDTVFTAKLDQYRASAPAGVKVDSYENLLTYYRSFTSGGRTGKLDNETDAFARRIDKVLAAYNIDFFEGNSDGTAGNMANNAIYYDDLGYDYNHNGVTYDYKKDADGNPLDADGNIVIQPKDAEPIYIYKDTSKPESEWIKKLDPGDHVLVMVEPKGAVFKNDGWPKDESVGYLEIDNTRYNDYFYVCRGINGKPTYIWYSKSKMPEKRNGAYGYASYNKNGLLSDGYVFSLDVALRVLEDYYKAPEDIKKLTAGMGGTFDSEGFVTNMKLDALRKQYEYYHTTPDLTEVWEHENAVSGRYTLTNGELDVLINMLTGAIGGAPLFDFLFEKVLSDEIILSLTQVLDLIFDNALKVDASLKDLIYGLLDSLGLGGVSIVVKRDATVDTNGDGVIDDSDKKSPMIGFIGGLFSEKWPDTDPEDEVDDSGFFLYLDGAPEHNLIDSLDDLLERTGLAAIVPTILGLVGLNMSAPEGSEDIGAVRGILAGLLEGLYWYKSPLIKPVYEFYENEEYDLNDNFEGSRRLLQRAYADQERATYEATLHGTMIGSPLIAGSGPLAGSPGDSGLYSLADVQQLQSELMYKGTFYPLFSVRDMLMTFVGIVVLMTILSYYCAELETEWATGKGKPRRKKLRKHRKKRFSDAGNMHGDGNQPYTPSEGYPEIVSGGPALPPPSRSENNGAGALPPPSSSGGQQYAQLLGPGQVEDTAPNGFGNNGKGAN